MYILPIVSSGGPMQLYWNNFIKCVPPYNDTDDWAAKRDAALLEYNAKIVNGDSWIDHELHFETAEDALLFKLRFS